MIRRLRQAWNRPLTPRQFWLAVLGALIGVFILFGMNPLAPVVFVASIFVVAGIGWLGERVVGRVPFRRTDARRLSDIYEAGYRLRSELKRQARYGELEGSHVWGGRVLEWDATIWTELIRTRVDWLPLQQTMHDLLYRDSAAWVDVSLQRLDERLDLLHRLMEEGPHTERRV